MEKIIFTEKEAAEYIKMSRGFLRQDRMNKTRENRTAGPPYLKIGRTIRYQRDDLDIWLDYHKVTHK